MVNSVTDIITCRYLKKKRKVHCKNMYVHNKCIVPSDSFKCKYIVVKVT